MRVWDRLVERAAHQHGYVTTRDARDLDIDPTQLRLMAARGRLERTGRGVYRVPILPRGVLLQSACELRIRPRRKTLGVEHGSRRVRVRASVIETTA